MSNLKDSGLSIHQMRLLTCAKIVRETTTPFDMGSWECGTAHCAIGDYCEAGVSEMKLVGGKGWRAPKLPSGLDHQVACMDEFNISLPELERLFGPDLRSDRNEVADRIEHFALHEHRDANVLVKT